MSLGWWRQWRRKRILATRAIPDALWQATLEQYPFLAGRRADERARLRELATLFLAAKEFSGAGGLVVTDAMAVAISAQACLPVLELGLQRYDGFVGIVVHADPVLARREHADDIGVVHEYDEELSGEAMHGGPVMLAWSDVADAGTTSAEAYNVVVHEFAHVLDMHGGLTEGAHEHRRDGARGAWLQALVDEYDAFCVGLIRRDESLLDPYAGEAVEEFFAVAAEAFFVAPRALQIERPKLYNLLREVFRQDPALTLA
ncbi:zinc-dependent peptidase [Piscinibacter koreensis]|uniref:Zinc-dependent peptidase n=1 Tax=Piscinibacter koreensis TaxID=2742824 RepID=A0A7Y6NQV2_9BURK|nr:M90 family metallopeptidase [Schlegelella koreensis]NUZ07631.1 zinc-dependent peptidase [Schlegelella koreensis]